MTCIAAIVRDGVAYMGGDSAVVDSDCSLFVCSTPKVIKAGCVLVGASGGGSLCRRALRDIAALHLCSLDEAACWRVTAALASLEEDDDDDGIYVIAACPVGGVVIFDHGGWVRPERQYGAIGSGGACATGVLCALYGEPRDRIYHALVAAEYHYSNVLRPFVVLTSDRKKRGKR